MRSLTLRMVLFVLFVAAAGLIAYQVWLLERDRASAETAVRSFDTLAGTALLNVAELRAAQQAYVAAGQGNTFWLERTDQIVTALNGDLTRLKEMTTDEQTLSALTTAAQTIGNFVELDKRVKEYARNRQFLMASDIIFTDGADLSRSTGRYVDAARAREIELAAQSAAERRRRQAYMVGALGVGTVILMLGLVLLPGRIQEPAQIPSGEPARVIPSPESSHAEMPGDRDFPPDPRPRSGMPALAATATLCTDLARLQHAGDLPPLLERAARLLNASGLVIWLADATGHELRPVVAHGYPASGLGRMPAVARDSDNATAAAFRSGKLTTVASTPVSTGAVVAPLVGNLGCVGVMTAEVRDGAEAREGVQALALIVAAQLVSLMPATDPVGVVQAQA